MTSNQAGVIVACCSLALVAGVWLVPGEPDSKKLALGIASSALSGAFALIQSSEKGGEN